MGELGDKPILTKDEILARLSSHAEEIRALVEPLKELLTKYDGALVGRITLVQTGFI